MKFKPKNKLWAFVVDGNLDGDVEFSGETLGVFETEEEAVEQMKQEASCNFGGWIYELTLTHVSKAEVKVRKLK